MLHPAFLGGCFDGSCGAGFPDVLGCVSAGDTLEGALAEGAAALAFHLEGTAEDGEPPPRPGSIERHRASPDWRTAEVLGGGERGAPTGGVQGEADPHHPPRADARADRRRRRAGGRHPLGLAAAGRGRPAPGRERGVACPSPTGGAKKRSGGAASKEPASARTRAAAP